jgi:hypothetical protein
MEVRQDGQIRPTHISLGKRKDGILKTTEQGKEVQEKGGRNIQGLEKR